MSDRIRIIETEDGSHSLYNASLKETYHSSHGALTESRHVFIREGLNHFYEKYNPPVIRIFEVGFGTGLNALLSWIWAEEKGIKVIYHSIEQFPLESQTVDLINYGELLNQMKKFRELHKASWEKEIDLSDNFFLKKIKSEWVNYSFDDKYDIIYYDAFAPSKQPEMWEKDLITRCFKALHEPGVITTYCARGQFKRDLKEAGFSVETLPGPPGKKEMVRGNKG